MADHLDAPGLSSPMGDPKTDITDVYAFLKPSDDDDGELPNTSILILNVNPLAPTLATEFESGAEYLLRVDTNNDHVEDITFRVTFSPKSDGTQTGKVERINAAGSRVVIAHAPVSFGSHAHITHRGPYKFFAGIRSDPFFFDLLGFIAGFKFTGSDFFIDKNVFSIVLEVPNHALGNTPATTSIWGRTRIRKGDGLINDDRMGRAAINTVFNHGNDKNLFNNLEPSQDLTGTTDPAGEMKGIKFVDSFAKTLIALGGPAIATVLLPDVLNYDFSKASGYLNGRRLQDDVIDISLSLVTGGKLTTDHVGQHHDYLDEFPFVGKPHVAEEED